MGLSFNATGMKFFKSKDEQSSRRALKQPVEVIQDVISSFGIGSRACYFVDHNEASRLETLIIGYFVNDGAVFKSRDLSISDGQLWLTVDQEKSLISPCDHFGLVVPSNIGEERKLDYQTRASLGRRGPFGVGKALTLISLSPNRENFKLKATVQRNLVVKEGVHCGHTVAVLDVSLASVEAFESRAETRLEINIAATVALPGKEKAYAAYVLDISERALRLVLDPPDTPASLLKIKSEVVVTMTLSPEKPPIILKGEVLQQRRREYIIEIQKIRRRNEFVDFEILDAMELKIHFQDACQQHQSIN